MAKEEIDFEEMFAENGVEAIATMATVINAQQHIALELTKLVIERHTGNPLKKEDIFKTYEEAARLVKKQLQE